MENPRHLSGSRIRPGTVIERSQIKFVIFKMQEDVNGVLARMINTSACKQPSNVSTLRCKMNRCKAPLIANIPRAQSPFLPRRAVIATAVPGLSSLGQTGEGPIVTWLGWDLGAVTPAAVTRGCRGEWDNGPSRAQVWGCSGYRFPAPVGQTGTNWDGVTQGTSPEPTALLCCICLHAEYNLYIFIRVQCLHGCTRVYVQGLHCARAQNVCVCSPGGVCSTLRVGACPRAVPAARARAGCAVHSPARRAAPPARDVGVFV